MKDKITVYTAAKGFNSMEMDISMPNELPDQSTKFPDHTCYPFFELWGRFPEMPAEFQFMGLIDISEEECQSVFFPHSTDVFHFLKEYMTVFTGILQLQKLSDEK